MSENLPDRLRIGDAERERTVERLAAAYAAGQLDHAEFSERSSKAWQARFADDLQALIIDLGPTAITDTVGVASALPAQLARPGSLVSAGTGVPLTVAFWSGSERRGNWQAAGTHTAIAVMGGVTVDLRQASFTEPVTRVACIAIMGGIEVIVPPWVRVTVHGLPIMGGFGADGPAYDQSGLPADAPQVIVEGLAVMGGVGVKFAELDEMLPLAEKPAIEA